MLKISVLLGFFVIFTALIWALGLRPGEEDAFLKYLVFASQLLYGNMCYDLMKSMREIPSSDSFWSSVMRVIGEILAWFAATFVLLVLAAKVFLLAYVGLLGALITYGYVFWRVMPKFQPLYKEASARAPKKSALS